MALDKVYVAAMSVSFTGAVFLSIALSTPHWLDNRPVHGHIDQFENGGLWSMCFNKWDPTQDSLQKQYDGCYYVFEKELEHIDQWIMPGWLIGVQILTSLSTFVLLVAGLVQFLHFMRFFAMDLVMRVGSAILSFFIAIFLCVAIILYGVRSSDALWMPNPERNYLSWSFVFAVLATFLSIVSAMLFVVTALTTRYKNKYPEGNDYRMEPRY